MALSEDGMLEAGRVLGVEMPALWAIVSVETRGCGFMRDRRPQILFERHWFHKLTDGRFDAAAPDISNDTSGGYGEPEAWQYDRLERAFKLDSEAALKSTSWGIGQVMGFNANLAGFPDVEEMVKAMCDSEDAQFHGMIGFIDKSGLGKHLKNEDWAAFAKGYNGPGYRKNSYDIKLAKEHARFKRGPMPELRVRAAQLYLNFLGYDTGGVDGWFGNKSLIAMNTYQKQTNLSVTSRLDNITFDTLQNQATG